MAVWNQIKSLVTDPPPAFVFELSEAGIAFAQNGQGSFEAFEPGTLIVSPVADNLPHPGLVSAVVERLAPSSGPKRKRRPSRDYPS